MKQKIIIPRKDHEIYFIPMPEGLKSNMAKKHVYDTLSELHPGFSVNSHVDIKSIVLNKKRWFMAAVIAADILAEYRIMYRGALFYTNTSILAYEKSFLSNNPASVDDELIGFDSEKNMPVSIPMDIEKTSGGQYLAGKLDHVSMRCSVFKRNNTKLFAAAILAGFAVLAVFLLVYFYSNTNMYKPVDIITEYDSSLRLEEQPAQIVYIPSAAGILAHISELFLLENGEIESWQFNEGAQPVIIIQSKNMSPLIAHTLFSGLEYIVLQDIQNVNYTDGKPRLTITLNLKLDIYSMPVSLPFTDKNTMFAEIEKLTDLLKDRNAAIYSEILPSVNNSFQSYTISFTADDKSLVHSMEVIEEFCEKYSIRVKSLNVSAEADKKTFVITCTFSQADILNGRIKKFDVKNESIPLAFGYRPVEVKRIKIQTEEKQTLISVPEERIVIGKMIGSIADADGKNIYFYNSDGKITIRNEQ